MKDFEDAMLEVSRENLDRVTNRFYSLDNKAAGIITISAVLMTIMISMGGGGYVMSKIFFWAAVISFGVAVVLSLKAIRTTDVYDVSTNVLIDELYNYKGPDRNMRIVATFGEAEDLWRDASARKARAIGNAVYALGISVLFMVLTGLTDTFTSFYPVS